MAKEYTERELVALAKGDEEAFIEAITLLIAEEKPENPQIMVLLGARSATLFERSHKR